MKIALEVKEVFEHMLGDGKSIINPEITIWTASAAEEIRKRVEDDPMEGTGQSQWEKLDHQLSGTPLNSFLKASNGTHP